MDEQERGITLLHALFSLSLILPSFFNLLGTFLAFIHLISIFLES